MNMHVAIERADLPRAACHHEAGHCVARWIFGAWTQSAEVLEVPETASPGGGSEAAYKSQGRIFGAHILYATWPPVSDRARRIAAGRGEMELVINVAGAVAEARFRKRSVASCWLEADLDREVCARIAAATMPGGEAPLDDAFRRATALMKAPAAWSAVTAIAAHLQVHGRIDGDAIDVVCAAAFGRRQPFPFEWDAHWLIGEEDLHAGWLPPVVAGSYSSAVGRGDLDLGRPFRTDAMRSAPGRRRIRSEQRVAE